VRVASCHLLVSQDAHDLSARDLDQVAAAEGLHQGPGLIHERPQVRGLDLPALSQLTNDELRVGVDEEAVVRRALACTLDAAHQVLYGSDQGPVLGLVVGRHAQVEADDLLAAVPVRQLIAAVAMIPGSMIETTAIGDQGKIKLETHDAPPRKMGWDSRMGFGYPHTRTR